MDTKAPVPHSTETIFELQFDGDVFSTDPNQKQPFWPHHNYTKEIRITNAIQIQVKDKEFLAKVKSGEIKPEKADLFEARLEILEDETYILTKVLKHTKSMKMQFKDV
jgi:hypothetical protein